MHLMSIVFLERSGPTSRVKDAVVYWFVDCRVSSVFALWYANIEGLVQWSISGLFLGHRGF